MKILVPVDGSPASIRAVKLAVAQVKTVAGASLVIVNIIDLATLGLPKRVKVAPSGWIEQDIESATMEALQDAVTICRQAEIPYVTRSEQGAVAATIDRVAREEDVAQIIMGTRGLGRVRGLLLGSVSTQVLHLADVPVTLVK